jgi:hypothetical protein
MKYFVLFAIAASGCATAGHKSQGLLLLHLKPAEARVLLDDHYIGSAGQLSGHLLKLATGMRRIEVTAEGHYGARREADVRVDHRAELTVELQPVPDGELGD